MGVQSAQQLLRRVLEAEGQQQQAASAERQPGQEVDRDGEIPIRLARVPTTPSPRTTAPISMSSDAGCMALRCSSSRGQAFFATVNVSMVTGSFGLPSPVGVDPPAAIFVNTSSPTVIFPNGVYWGPSWLSL